MLDWEARGAVAPSVFYRPRWLSTLGGDVVEIAADCGLFYDPWQCLALEEMLGRTTPEPWGSGSRWSSPEVGLIMSRQNGKDSIIEGICLASLFLWREAFVHSAHQFKTTKKAFLRLRALILANPDLRARLLQPVEGRGITTGIGNEGIHLAERMDNGDPVEGMYVARSGGSGRGFTVPRVIYNEAWDLDADSIAAQTPAQATFRDPQTIYVSSSPDQQKHPNSQVIGALRMRARSGSDPDLCWEEWSAAPDAAPGADTAQARRRRHDEGAYAQANPSLGIVRPDGSAGVGAAFLHRQARSPMGPRWFDIEHLGIGDWPTGDVARWRVIGKDAWQARQGAELRPVPPPPLVLAVAGSWPDAEWCSIGAFWEDGDEGVVEVVDRQPGTAWVIPRIEKLAVDFGRELRGVAVAKSGTAAAALLGDLQETDLPLLVLDTGQETAAAAGFRADVDGDAPTVRHYGQAVLDESVGAAGKHHIGDRWRWDRNGTSDPVEAVTLAHAGYSAAQPKTPAFY